MRQIVVISHNKKELKHVGLKKEFGTSYYISSDKNFLKEVEKFECPVRFAMFLNENQSSYDYISADLYVKSYDDIILDFSKRQIEYLCDEVFKHVLENRPNEFIEKTPEYNKYGKIGL